MIDVSLQEAIHILKSCGDEIVLRIMRDAKHSARNFTGVDDSGIPRTGSTQLQVKRPSLTNFGPTASGAHPSRSAPKPPRPGPPSPLVMRSVKGGLDVPSSNMAQPGAPPGSPAPQRLPPPSPQVLRQASTSKSITGTATDISAAASKFKKPHPAVAHGDGAVKMRVRPPPPVVPPTVDPRLSALTAKFQRVSALITEPVCHVSSVDYA